jgi:hypothetical protein
MADELSFAGDIRPLFRDSDVNSMSFAFDLASYEDVRTHGEAIYATLAPAACGATAHGRTMMCSGSAPGSTAARGLRHSMPGLGSASKG